MYFNNKDCNGWSNPATYNVFQMYSEMFDEMMETQEYDDVAHVADSFESMVYDCEFSYLTQSRAFTVYIVDYFLSQVNWQEIAEHVYELHQPLPQSTTTQ